jgi:hypothetical protein
MTHSDDPSRIPLTLTMLEYALERVKQFWDEEDAWRQSSFVWQAEQAANHVVRDLEALHPGGLPDDLGTRLTSALELCAAARAREEEDRNKPRILKSRPEPAPPEKEVPPEGLSLKDQLAWYKARSDVFWDDVYGRISNLPGATCEEIVRLGKEFGVAMNGIASIMKRRQIGFTWDDRYDVGVGRHLYQHALTVLDQYDPDFRPEPGKDLMHETEDGTGTKLKLFYQPHINMFEVEVSRGEQTLTETFKAGFPPKFGVDVSDHNQALSIGEKLAARLDAESEMPTPDQS